MILCIVSSYLFLIHLCPCRGTVTRTRTLWVSPYLAWCPESSPSAGWVNACMDGQTGWQCAVCVVAVQRCSEVALTKHFTKQGSQNKGFWALRREPLRRERPFWGQLCGCQLECGSCRETSPGAAGRLLLPLSHLLLAVRKPLLGP